MWHLESEVHVLEVSHAKSALGIARPYQSARKKTGITKLRSLASEALQPPQKPRYRSVFFDVV